MGTVFTAPDAHPQTEDVEDVWILKEEVRDMKSKVIKALRVVSGIVVVAGFILALGVVGADDVATATGVYTSISELIKNLSICMAMILGGTVGLNIL